MRTDRELLELLRKYAHTGHLGVRIKFLPERYFSKTSMLGETRADYLEKMRADGIQLHKTYSAIRVDGYGDVADLVVINDNGKEKSFMAFLFRDVDESLGE